MPPAPASWSPGTPRCWTKWPPPWSGSWPGLARGELARESLETVRRPGAGPRRRTRRSPASTKSPRSTCTWPRATRRAWSSEIDNAGAIFLGTYSPVALGDYAAGPSHVLPTGGTARFASGLSANDFLRRSSVLAFTPAGLTQMADDVRLLAGQGRADRPRRQRGHPPYRNRNRAAQIMARVRSPPIPERKPSMAGCLNS